MQQALLARGSPQTEKPPQIEGAQVTPHQVCAQRYQRVHPSFAILPIPPLTFGDEFEDREVLCLTHTQTFSHTMGRHVLRVERSPGEPQYQLEHATVCCVDKGIEIFLHQDIGVAFEISPVICVYETRCRDFSARREGSKLPDFTVV